MARAGPYGPAMDEPLQTPRRATGGRVLTVIAVTVVALAVVAGLAWLGFMVLVVVAMGSYGSNK